MLQVEIVIVSTTHKTEITIFMDPHKDLWACGLPLPAYMYDHTAEHKKG
jgi:hypothetical protein